MKASELKLETPFESPNTPTPSEEQIPKTETVVRSSRGSWNLINLDELWRYRELIYFLCWRDIKVKYKQAAFGVAWVVAQPLFTMVTFTFLFGRVAKMDSEGLPYSAFSFCALVPWNYFVSAINRGSLSLAGSGALFSKVYFPRLVIPIASVMAGLLDYVIAVGTLVLVLGWYGYYPQVQWLLGIPALTCSMVALACALSFWLGALNVKYRDVGHLLPFFVQLWMFLTPIVYPLSAIPKRFHLWAKLNPMTGIIEAYRSVFFNRICDWQALGISLAMTVCLLISGMFYFAKTERKFADIV
ncbi:MAG: ABC transporter permease [Proteobacteria bacterium]|nr:ABC transporter permease [Pseudomonadota bacterium]NDC23696.1 ABC transporter permease [Pseudomonadota bacterium]NDD03871.1 ABC transporter permease [Pseudomonadota bacterium]NDG25663.1 ABC transporter permease [Pseudomonadota bacterium]